MALNFETDPPHHCGRKVKIVAVSEKNYEMHCDECSRVLGDWIYIPRPRPYALFEGDGVRVRK